MTLTVIVVDSVQDAVVHTFNQPQELIPNEGDTVWVPDNGDVAYLVTRRQFDYENEECRVICKPNPNKTQEQ